MKIKSITRILVVALTALGAMNAAAQPKPAASPVKIDAETISGLGARNIGSATMSGRISAIDAVHESNRLTVYVAAASGGVWKSVNGGTTFKPVFDKQPVQSIGKILVIWRENKENEGTQPFSENKGTGKGSRPLSKAPTRTSRPRSPAPSRPPASEPRRRRPRTSR